MTTKTKKKVLPPNLFRGEASLTAFKPLTPNGHPCYKQRTISILRPAKPKEDTLIKGQHVFYGENQCSSTVEGECARTVHKCKTGEGYHLCGQHGGHVHSEGAAILEATKAYFSEYWPEMGEAILQIAHVQAHFPTQPKLKPYVKDGFADVEKIMPKKFHNLFEPFAFNLTIDGHYTICEMCRRTCVFLGIYLLKTTHLVTQAQKGEKPTDALDRAKKEAMWYDMSKGRVL
jgi:hypothetical protein